MHIIKFTDASSCALNTQFNSVAVTHGAIIRFRFSRLFQLFKLQVAAFYPLPGNDNIKQRFGGVNHSKDTLIANCQTVLSDKFLPTSQQSASSGVVLFEFDTPSSSTRNPKDDITNSPVKVFLDKLGWQTLKNKKRKGKSSKVNNKI